MKARFLIPRTSKYSKKTNFITEPVTPFIHFFYLWVYQRRGEQQKILPFPKGQIWSGVLQENMYLVCSSVGYIKCFHNYIEMNVLDKEFCCGFCTTLHFLQAA